jgi:hypothetical protein
MEAIEAELRNVVAPAVDILTKVTPSRSGLEGVTGVVRKSILCSEDERSTEQHQELMVCASAALVFSLFALELFPEVHVCGEAPVRTSIILHVNALSCYLSDFVPGSKLWLLDESMITALHLHEPPTRDLAAFRYGLEFAA